MSLEAWGDDDGAGEHDHLIDAGWWSSEKAGEVEAAIEALSRESLYEDGDSAKGVSVLFIARMHVLRGAAELEVPSDLLAEARALCEAADAK